jgi:hypothetical protein
MGTRGAVTLVANGKAHTIYNHFDSYPDCLGNDVLGWLRAVLEYGPDGEAAAKISIGNLTPVPDREPTADERKRFSPFTDSRVSSGDDWYALLRHTQGNIPAMLAAGYYEPADKFPLDSLFCEWAYVVDFDARVFEIYRGFQHGPATEGRWAGQQGTTGGYGPVQRISQFPFDVLPVELFEEEDGDETVAYGILRRGDGEKGQVAVRSIEPGDWPTPQAIEG